MYVPPKDDPLIKEAHEEWARQADALISFLESCDPHNADNDFAVRLNHLQADYVVASVKMTSAFKGNESPGSEAVVAGRQLVATSDKIKAVGDGLRELTPQGLAWANEGLGRSSMLVVIMLTGASSVVCMHKIALERGGYHNYSDIMAARPEKMLAALLTFANKLETYTVQ